MKTTGRITLGVLAGAIAWALLWNLGTRLTQAALPDIVRPDQPLTHTGVLLGYIAYSVALSLLAGYIAAWAAGAGGRAMWAVWILAMLQLGLGLFFEISFWSMLPVWYHLVFLALIVPATVYGGLLRERRHVEGRSVGRPVPRGQGVPL